RWEPVRAASDGTMSRTTAGPASLIFRFSGPGIPATISAAPAPTTPPADTSPGAPVAVFARPLANAPHGSRRESRDSFGPKKRSERDQNVRRRLRLGRGGFVFDRASDTWSPASA